MGVDPLTAGIGILAAGTLFGAKEARTSRKEASAEAARRKSSAVKLGEEEEKKRIQTIARQRKRRGAVGEPGQRSDIFTSPLGITGAPGQAGKTLLGS
jgi:hypothetical protein